MKLNRSLELPLYDLTIIRLEQVSSSGRIVVYDFSQLWKGRGDHSVVTAVVVSDETVSAGGVYVRPR
jgi:hypothetical protein